MTILDSVLGLPLGATLGAPVGDSGMPPSTDGLVMYLDAAAPYITLNGSNVSGWANRHGGTGDYSQGTASAQPLYSASDANFNGRPSVRCQSGDSLVGVANALYTHSNTESAVWLWVGRINGPSPSAWILWDNSNNGVHQFNGTDYNLRQDTTFYPGVTVPLETPLILMAVVDADASEYARVVNGGAVARSSVTIQDTTAHAGTAPRLNAFAGGAFNAADLTTAALLYWNYGDGRAVSDSYIESIRDWANARWKVY